jgi:HSP20 family protein
MFHLIPLRRREGTRMENPLVQLRDEFDSLFDRFFGRWSPFGMEEAQNGWGFDVNDEGNTFVVRAEAPGFEPEDFDVQVQGNVLTVRAERKHEAGKDKEENGSYTERRVQRAITLPAGADTNNVQAIYRNGILELRLPKLPEAQGRRIEVKKN